MSSKVVVFGGSGFLGSHVADELTSRGHRVVIFDRKTSPYLNLKQEMLVGDILDAAAVRAACHEASIVYNFAGEADIAQSASDPVRTAQLNIIGNLNILEACRVERVRRFVYASTVYVYSRHGSFYRVTKQAAENFVEMYNEKHGIKFTILRYGSLYGRRADRKNAIHNFIHSALFSQRISYAGTGDELREYIHVADAARASVEILTNEYENERLVITGPQSLRIRDVMMMIKEIMHGRVEMKFENQDLDSHYNITPYSYRPKLGKKLVMNPFIDMGQGILDCLDEIALLNKQRAEGANR